MYLHRYDNRSMMDDDRRGLVYLNEETGASDLLSFSVGSFDDEVVSTMKRKMNFFQGRSMEKQTVV